MKTDKEYIEEIYEKHKEVVTVKIKNEFYQMKFEEKKYNPLKMVAIFVLTIGITVGIAYATNSNIKNSSQENKIWKEPKEYQLNNQTQLTEEEIAKCISEQEARKYTNEALRKIGLEEDEVLEIRLEKDFLSNENEWYIGTNKATITLDAQKGELKSIQVPTWNYRIPYNYGITRQEAKVVAQELLTKLKPRHVGQT